MSQVFAYDLPRFPDLYSDGQAFAGQDLYSFLDGEDSRFVFDLGGALPSEKELSGEQFHSADCLTYLDSNYRGGSDYHVRPLKAAIIDYPQREEYKPDVSYDVYSSPTTTSRSPCFSDDLSENAFSPRSSVSSQCDMASWPYTTDSFAPYGVSASGYHNSEFTQNVSLSSIQGFSDDVQDAAIEPHDYTYIHDHSFLNNVPTAGIEEATSFNAAEPSQTDDIHEPVRRRKRAEELSPGSLADDDNEEDSDYKPSSRRSAGPRRPRRRASTSHANTTAPQGKNRGHRRTASEKTGLKRKGSVRKPRKADPLRPFPCPLALYGCQSTFTSKNEWKRHVSTQHVKLGFWRCDLCPPSPDPTNPIYNDFNRKDLFTQHVRRMHVGEIMGDTDALDASGDGKGGGIPEDVMAEQQSRCYHRLRAHPIRSGCLFCEHVFEGHNSWEQRMEHLGGHFEREKKNPKQSLDTSRWREDAELREWFEREGLIERDNKGGWRIGDGQPQRPGQFLRV